MLTLRGVKTVVLSILLCWLSVAQAEALPDSMIWLAEPDETERVRVNERTFAVIADHLPVLVKYQYANTRRALMLMETSDELMCRGNLIPTQERLASFVMTRQPQVVFPAQHLFSRLDLGDQQAVSLQHLLAERIGVLGVHTARSYGLDEELLAEQFPEQVYSIDSGDSNAAPIQLLLGNRVDFIIEYPNVFDAYVEQASDFHSYPLQGYVAAIFGHIACSDTPAGQALVKQLDNIIQKVSAQRVYLDAHLQWFPTAKQSLIRAYNAAYGTQF